MQVFSSSVMCHFYPLTLNCANDVIGGHEINLVSLFVLRFYMRSTLSCHLYNEWENVWCKQPIKWHEDILYFVYLVLRPACVCQTPPCLLQLCVFLGHHAAERESHRAKKKATTRTDVRNLLNTSCFHPVCEYQPNREGSLGLHCSFPGAAEKSFPIREWRKPARLSFAQPESMSGPSVLQRRVGSGVTPVDKQHPSTIYLTCARSFAFGYEALAWVLLVRCDCISCFCANNDE